MFAGVTSDACAAKLLINGTQALTKYSVAKALTPGFADEWLNGELGYSLKEVQILICQCFPNPFEAATPRARYGDRSRVCEGAAGGVRRDFRLAV